MIQALIAKYEGYTLISINTKIDGVCVPMTYPQIQEAKSKLYKDVDCIMLYPKQSKNVDNAHEYHLLDIQGFEYPFNLQDMELYECLEHEIKSIP